MSINNSLVSRDTCAIHGMVKKKFILLRLLICPMTGLPLQTKCVLNQLGELYKR